MELKQNYPNPFNPATEISFKRQKPSRVVVQIFNTLGLEIRTLNQQQYEAGSHTLLAYFSGRVFISTVHLLWLSCS